MREGGGGGVTVYVETARRVSRSLCGRAEMSEARGGLVLSIRRKGEALVGGDVYICGLIGLVA